MCGPDEHWDSYFKKCVLNEPACTNCPEPNPNPVPPTPTQQTFSCVIDDASYENCYRYAYDADGLLVYELDQSGCYITTPLVYAVWVWVENDWHLAMINNQSTGGGLGLFNRLCNWFQGFNPTSLNAVVEKRSDAYGETTSGYAIMYKVITIDGI